MSYRATAVVTSDTINELAADLRRRNKLDPETDQTSTGDILLRCDGSGMVRVYRAIFDVAPSGVIFPINYTSVI